MERFRFFADRSAVLFLGLASGLVVGLAFVANRPTPAAQIVAAAPVKTDPLPAPIAPPVSDEAFQTFSPRLLKAVASDQTLNVGVFGDSFGDGLWSSLNQQLPRAGRYKVFQYSKQATGFTRYESQNLETSALENLKAQPIDIAVISFGANDTQGIYADGHLHPLLSPGWKAVYAHRMARFVSVLRQQGAVVYWVGLPRMRKPEYDAQIHQMNDFYAEESRRLGVSFLPTEALSLDASGQFNLYLPDPVTHQPKLMRANDGIHMTFAGYSRLTAPLVERIGAYVDRARAYQIEMTGEAIPKSAPVTASHPHGHAK
jgi:hypothetical protein